MPETDPTEPLPTEPAPFVEVFDGFEMADDDRVTGSDNGYPGPCTEPDYQGIVERRGEFRGRFWQEP